MAMDVLDDLHGRADRYGFGGMGDQWGTTRSYTTSTGYGSGYSTTYTSYNGRSSSHSTTYTTSTEYSYGEPLAQQLLRCCIVLTCGAIVTTYCPSCHCTICGCDWLGILINAFF